MLSSTLDMDDDSESQDGPSGPVGTAFAYIARVRVPSIADKSNVENGKPSDSNIVLAAPPSEGVCTQSKRRCQAGRIDNAAKATDLQHPEGATRLQHSAQVSDLKENESESIPDLIEDNMDQETIYIPMTSVVYAEYDKILTPDIVYTQVFPDDVLRCEKITGEIISLQQILRGPMKPTIEQLER